MIHKEVFDMVGRTPSVLLKSADKDGPRFFLKLEGCNPTGSIKDRACVFMLRSALTHGFLQPGKVILDASSGNFACALAFYGKVLGYSSVVAVSSKITAAKRDFLTYLGTRIHTVGDFTIQGNEFCRRLAESDPTYYFVDQLHNWENPRAHYETTGPEIMLEFPDVAMVVGSLGSGGSMTGVAQYIKGVAPQVQVVVVESSSSTRIPGVGAFVDGDYITPFIQKARNEAYFDHVVQIKEIDAARTVEILVAQGIFAGLQTGAVVHAALNCALNFGVKGSVVVLSGDTGWKNLDKLMASETLFKGAEGECISM